MFDPFQASQITLFCEGAVARFSSTGGQRERPVADGMVWIDFELIFKIKMKLVGRLFDEPCGFYYKAKLAAKKRFFLASICREY